MEHQGSGGGQGRPSSLSFTTPPGSHIVSPPTSQSPRYSFYWAQLRDINNKQQLAGCDVRPLDRVTANASTHPALLAVFAAADRFLVVPQIEKALLSSFEEDDAPTRAALREALATTLHVYATRWADDCWEAFAFHAPEASLPFGDLVHKNNVFIKFNDLDAALRMPRDTSSWTMPQKRFLLKLAWTVMHERAHAVASLLKTMGVITNTDTPPGASAYNLFRFMRRKPGTGEALGERGMYVASKAGGFLRGKVESDPRAQGGVYLEELYCQVATKENNRQDQFFLIPDTTSAVKMTATDVNALKGRQEELGVDPSEVEEAQALKR